MSSRAGPAASVSVLGQLEGDKKEVETADVLLVDSRGYLLMPDLLCICY